MAIAIMLAEICLHHSVGHTFDLSAKDEPRGQSRDNMPLVITQQSSTQGQRPDLFDPENAVNQNRGNSLTYLLGASGVR